METFIEPVITTQAEAIRYANAIIQLAPLGYLPTNQLWHFNRRGIIVNLEEISLDSIELYESGHRLSLWAQQQGVLINE